jgi:hypothetical protein
MATPQVNEKILHRDTVVGLLHSIIGEPRDRAVV